LRAVNGLNPVTRGAVRVRGQAGEMTDVVSCSPARLRALRRGTVSMVFQQFALLPWRSVIENVALGLELGGMARTARLAKAREVLATVGLEAWAEKRVGELSGGMQQRVGLARAFATDADILLMDEPFSALDPLIRARLQDELLELQEGMRCTIVFVSHDLEEAVKLGNTITILEGGRIVQTGAPEDIVLRPATAYVAEFVARLNPLSVLRAGDVMGPATVPADPARVVAPQTPLRDTLALFAAADAPVWVADAGGVLGAITPDAVFRVLAPRGGDGA
jgi:glycine betaine/proline transport system ATP-binding protein